MIKISLETVNKSEDSSSMEDNLNMYISNEYFPGSSKKTLERYSRDEKLLDSSKGSLDFESSRWVSFQYNIANLSQRKDYQEQLVNDYSHDKALTLLKGIPKSMGRGEVEAFVQMVKLITPKLNIKTLCKYYAAVKYDHYRDIVDPAKSAMREKLLELLKIEDRVNWKYLIDESDWIRSVLLDLEEADVLTIFTDLLRDGESSEALDILSSKLYQAPEDSLADVITMGLANQSVVTRANAADHISRLKNSNIKNELIETALNDKDIRVLLEVSKDSHYLSDDQKSKLDSSISVTLNEDSPLSDEEVLGYIEGDRFSSKDRPGHMAIYLRGLEIAVEKRDSRLLEKIISKGIYSMPSAEAENILRETISTYPLKDIHDFIFRHVNLLPKSESMILRKQGLLSNDPEIVSSSLDDSHDLSIKDREDLINHIIDNNKRDSLASAMIRLVDYRYAEISSRKEKREYFLSTFWSLFNKGDEDSLLMSTFISFYGSMKAPLSMDEVTRILSAFMLSENDELQEAAVTMALRRNWFRISEVWDHLFDNGSDKVMMKLLLRPDYLSEENRQKIVAAASALGEKGLLALLESGEITSRERKKAFSLLKLNSSECKSIVSSGLYKRDPEKVGFREISNLKGTESIDGTLTLSSKLYDKGLIRRIKSRPFMAWHKAFSSPKKWNDAGFDYVPVEPIMSFSPTQNGKSMDVSVATLDMTLSRYISSFDNKPTRLLEMKDRILQTLREIGAPFAPGTPRHEHNSNFCLRFARTESGDIDFSKEPRLYIIDFDHSRLTENK